jgi:DNA replication protein DnaC
LYAPDRKLNRGLIERLACCDWIRNGEHCVITGATSSCKTWLASALMNAAIRAGFRAKYYRVNDLLLEYAESASNTTLRTNRKKQLNRYHQLMIDEFGLGGLAANQRADLLEIINERKREWAKA